MTQLVRQEACQFEQLVGESYVYTFVSVVEIQNISCGMPPRLFVVASLMTSWVRNVVAAKCAALPQQSDGRRLRMRMEKDAETK